VEGIFLYHEFSMQFIAKLTLEIRSARTYLRLTNIFTWVVLILVAISEMNILGMQILNGQGPQVENK